MVRAARAVEQRGRSSTSSALRVLGALLALLLTASSLGQIAHFMVVEHAICVEHGELLEVTEHATHPAADHHAEVAAGHEPGSSSEGAAGHDHCQVLAGAAREQLVPSAPVLVIHAAAAGVSTPIARPARGVKSPLPPLFVAPKTSPPRAAIV